jgi:DNA-binding SARP family transcriptional activator
MNSSRFGFIDRRAKPSARLRSMVTRVDDDAFPSGYGALDEPRTDSSHLSAHARSKASLPDLCRRSDSIPAMTVQMLNGFHIWIGEAELQALPCGKLGSLLKLLILNRRRPLSRARLCALFWPDVDDADARNSLNVSVYKLRRLFGEAAQVRFADDAYQLLVHGDVWLDVEQFEWLAAQGMSEDRQGQGAAAIQAYRAAAELYVSDLVSHPELDSALGQRAMALRATLTQALTSLASLLEAAEDVHGCLLAALRCLDLDECNESAQRQMMRCYAQLHQPIAVEQQYRHLVQTLRRQLGVGPSAETTSLYRHLAERRVA